MNGFVLVVMTYDRSVPYGVVDSFPFFSAEERLFQAFEKRFNAVLSRRVQGGAPVANLVEVIG